MCVYINLFPFIYIFIYILVSLPISKPFASLLIVGPVYYFTTQEHKQNIVFSFFCPFVHDLFRSCYLLYIKFQLSFAFHRITGPLRSCAVPWIPSSSNSTSTTSLFSFLAVLVSFSHALVLSSFPYPTVPSTTD